MKANVKKDNNHDPKHGYTLDNVEVKIWRGINNVSIIQNLNESSEIKQTEKRGGTANSIHKLWMEGMTTTEERDQRFIREFKMDPNWMEIAVSRIEQAESCGKTISQMQSECDAKCKVFHDNMKALGMYDGIDFDDMNEEDQKKCEEYIDKNYVVEDKMSKLHDLQLLMKALSGTEYNKDGKYNEK